MGDSFNLPKIKMMAFLVVYITHPDEATARQISTALVARKLAACANYFPIQSMYTWQAVISQDTEWVSVVKTTPAAWPALEAAVMAMHPYEIPCLTYWEVKANEAYEAWVYASVQ